jgi:ABC-type transporter Mla subunit MlaD
MKMALSETIVDAVGNSNFKVMSEMQLTNTLNHQNRVNVIAEASLGTILERMNTLDPVEAGGVASVLSSDLAEKIGQLSAAVASAQQLMKGANTTPQETGQ